MNSLHSELPRSQNFFLQIAVTGVIAVLDSNMENAENSKKYYVSWSQSDFSLPNYI